MPVFLGLFSELFDPAFLLTNPVVLLGAGFQLWMFVHAVQRREWVWAAFIGIFSLLTAVLYFFFVYRQEPSSLRGFELPGAQDRRRIKALQGQIHHLDKAHHHLQLGDIYFSQGRLKEAEKSYRSALEREPQDRDAIAHLGQCLLRAKRAPEALPLLHQVCGAEPKHDYGHTLMALAEAFTAVDRRKDAIQVWRKVLVHYQYDRARVQLAELLQEAGEIAEATKLVESVVEDADHGTPFERRRNKIWVRRAKALRRRLP
jgi:hypothetical protein